MRIPRFVRTPSGLIGLTLLVAILLFALLGPLVAPHSVDRPIGAPGAPPGGDALLGTDYLGRDVLSRVLHGGTSVIGMGVAATLLSYIAGLAVGLTAGYSRSILDPVLMRGVDVLLSFPALITLLLLVSGLGSSVPVLLLGVVVIQMPGIARVIRSTTQEAAARGFVEAAVARGESTPAILTREILPNIGAVVLADVGVRFGYSIIAIASVNYLGLGLQPPTADWGLMISENRQIIDLNVWAVLAPAIPLALLTIAVNLVGDAYARSLGTTSVLGAPWRRRRIRAAAQEVSA